MADQQTLLSWSASIRKQKEQGGFVLNGSRVDTDTDSRTFMTAAYIRAKEDPGFIIQNWKIEDGVYVTLDNATIVAIGLAVLSFIESCFTRNKQVDDLILSGQITTRDEIIAAFEELV